VYTGVGCHPGSKGDAGVPTEMMLLAASGLSPAKSHEVVTSRLHIRYAWWRGTEGREGPCAL
jgi:hypothetical protein